jgi:hypothetical protein
MSYGKVKSIKIDEKQGKVFFNTASNNVRPLTYSVWGESKIYNDLLKEKGKGAVEIEILKEYESGNLQEGKNKYTKALKVLRYVFNEEYKKFNWRNRPWGDEKKSKELEDLRKSEEWNNLLKKALDYKFDKKKFVITKDNFGEKIFGKSCLTCIKWSKFKEKATKFDFEEEAKDHIFKKYKNEWKVEEFKVESKEEQILNELNQFHGTEQYHKSTFGQLKLTDGINYLRNKVNCFWLIDIIESVQYLKKIKENSFIVWKIEVKDDSFIVRAYSDIANTNSKDNTKYILYEQKGDYTDFPLNNYEFYQINDVVLLKNEY